MTGTHNNISVKNDINELPRIYEVLEVFFVSFEVPAYTRRSVLLIAEELFSNTVVHGYPAGKLDEITMNVTMENGEVALVFRDQAFAFDNSALPDIEPENIAVEHRKVGGLGLFLVHELAASVNNFRQDEVNVTEVRIKFDSGG